MIIHKILIETRRTRSTVINGMQKVSSTNDDFFLKKMQQQAYQLHVNTYLGQQSMTICQLGYCGLSGLL